MRVLSWVISLYVKPLPARLSTISTNESTTIHTNISTMAGKFFHTESDIQIYFEKVIKIFWISSVNLNINDEGTTFSTMFVCHTSTSHILSYATIDNTIYHTVNITKESTIVHTVYNTMDRYYNNNITIISWFVQPTENGK